MDIDFVPSPNHSSRKGVDVTGIVIHYTAAGSARGSIMWFQMLESQASAHYVIERDGDITRMVKLLRKAWHAGISRMEHKGSLSRNVNAFTIGIELANCGRLTTIDGDHFYEAGRKLVPYRGPDPVKATLHYDSGVAVTGWWEPYPGTQILALQELLGKLRDIGYADAVANLVGHEEISGPDLRPDRFKMDPGGVFPWESFSRTTPRRTESILAAA